MKYHAEYRVEDHVGVGEGQTKRIAKNRAAMALMRDLMDRRARLAPT